MYRPSKAKASSIKVNEAYVGETIESKVSRILNNGEPIKDGAPRIYTSREDGVRPEYDIRTDRFEVAIDAMDAVSRAHIAKREARIEDAKKNMEVEKKSETVVSKGGETGGDGEAKS